MSYKFKKPYTKEEKINFIVEYNHKKGLQIAETDIALYALEDNEIMSEGEPIIDPEYEIKQEAKEQERIAMLSLTAADVERGIYKATGMDFDDIVAKVQEIATTTPRNNDDGDSLAMTIDVKALKIELKANNFYRGNAYVDSVGSILGFTSKQLDEFFETNDYEKLLN